MIGCASFTSSTDHEWDEPIEPPEDIADLELLFEGLVHWMSGHFGSGKSTIAAAMCLRAMEAGRHVFWLDWEVSRTQVRQRLSNAGITQALARQWLTVASAPTLPGNDRAAEALFNWMVDRTGGEDTAARSVVVIDSYTKAHARSGARESEQDNTAVSAWIDTVVIALKRRGVTVVVIDHPTKDQKDDSIYVGRGAGAKADDADLAYFAVAEVKFKRDQIGRVKLVCQKDREAVLDFGGWWHGPTAYPSGVRYFEVGDAKGNLPVEPIDPPPDLAEDAGLSLADRGALLILGAMRLAAASGGTLTTAELAAAAGLDRKSSAFKGGKGATDIAIARGWIERVGKGVYGPSSDLTLDSPELG